MLFHFSKNSSAGSRLAAVALLISTFTSLTQAQIPSFLTGQIARNSGNLELDVFYGTNQLNDGESLAPGLTPTKFALCDSCGISTSSRFTILLIDVDSSPGESPQFLHAIQSDFRIVEATELQSTTPPALPYIPATVAQANGRAKRYVWLLYNQQPRTGGAAFVLQGVPNAASRAQFNVAEFERVNGFETGGPEWAVHFTLESGGAVVIPSESLSLGIPTRTDLTPTSTTTTIVVPPTTTSSTASVAASDIFSLSVTRTEIGGGVSTTTTIVSRSTFTTSTVTTLPVTTTTSSSTRPQTTVTTTSAAVTPSANASTTIPAANTTSPGGGDSAAVSLSAREMLIWSALLPIAAILLHL
ncbi:hypothetical protein DFH27DRAFT_569496 [Peziza echinospora]|nr:hypothetical protein DFH27DRAFT_569496 [Peziza echinospora]